MTRILHVDCSKAIPIRLKAYQAQSVCQDNEKHGQGRNTEEISCDSRNEIHDLYTHVHASPR